MSVLWKGRIFLPNVNQIRCKSKLNVQKPRERFPRRLFKALMEPIVVPRKIDRSQRCAEKKANFINRINSEVNEYEEFLFRQCKQTLETKKMIVICQELPWPVRERTKVENKFLSMDMKLKRMNNNLMRRAIEGTKRETIKPLLNGSNIYLLSDDLRIREMMSVMKKVHHLVILGVLTENHILSYHDVIRLSETDLETARGELVSILAHGVSKTHSLLGSHQSNLVRNLEQYMRQLGGDAPEPSTLGTATQASSSETSSPESSVDSNPPDSEI